jgi:hypothetical protein
MNVYEDHGDRLVPLDAVDVSHHQHRERLLPAEKRHSWGWASASDLPPRSDIQMLMSVFVQISSALTPEGDMGAT